MAKQFNFTNDHLLKLNIGGHEFIIDTTDIELLEEIEETSKKAIEMSKKMEGGLEDLRILYEFIVEFLDLMLGEGATKKIFTDKRVSLFPALDLISFVTEEISNFRAEQLTEYVSNK